MKIKICLTLLICTMFFVYMQDASATDAISAVLCKVTNMLTGSIGQAIATIGVVVLGAGLFTGKLSWTTAVATAAGIGLIFGAANLAQWFAVGSGSAGATSSCSTSVTTS